MNTFRELLEGKVEDRVLSWAKANADESEMQAIIDEIKGSKHKLDSKNGRLYFNYVGNSTKTDNKFHTNNLKSGDGYRMLLDFIEKHGLKKTPPVVNISGNSNSGKFKIKVSMSIY